MKFIQLKTGPRVLISFAMVLFVMACITGIALWRLHAANDNTDYLVKDKLAKQQLASELLGTAKLNGNNAMSIAKSDSLETGEYFQAQLTLGDKAVERLMAQMNALPRNGTEAALFDEVAKGQKAYLAVRKEVFAFKDQGRTQEVEQLTGTTMKTTFGVYAAALSKLLDYQTREANALAAASASHGIANGCRWAMATAARGCSRWRSTHAPGCGVSAVTMARSWA